MHIPEHLQHFQHSALVVAADRFEAKIFMAGGDSLEALDGVAVPPEKYSDNETTNSSPDSEMKDEERFKHFVKALATELTALVRQHQVATVHLVMPAEVAHALEAGLEQHVKQAVGRKIAKDLAHENPVQILEALFA